MTAALGPKWNAIEAEVPGLTVRSVVRAGEGWTAIAYRVNDGFVIKFPKRAEAWDELDREIAFLQHARARLPLPVPQSVCRVRESAGAPHGYVVYRSIPGQAIDPRSLSTRAHAALAHSLGEFLRVLHDMDPQPVASLLPCEEPHATAVLYQGDADAVIAPRLSRVERRALTDVFTRYLNDPLNFPKQSRVLHADLSAEHVLCADGAVTGIIDWGDVSLGDPDYDFSYLYEDFGEAFVRDMARRYGHTDPDRLVSKAHYYSIADQVSTIVYGGEVALPGDVDGSWVRLHALLEGREP